MHDRIPPSIHPLLLQYAELLQIELPDAFHGVHLYGSIALGAYDDQKSDIDFVTTINRSLTADELSRLKNVHRRLLRSSPLAKRMDGMYIRLEDVGKVNGELQPYPCCASGTFKPSAYWDVNHITWWTLKHHAIPVAGRELQPLIRTDWRDVSDTLKYNIEDYWAQKAEKRLCFLLDEWVESAVLTLCRIEYTLQEQHIISKTGAGEHALAVLPEQWHPQVHEALRIRTGSGIPAFSSRLRRAAAIQHFLKERIRFCQEHYFS
ncbi:DUF4111 domain-containing protein [Paenibacillus profundus]|uniref:DUF4111 domain-containing protein n=2 Tax=Paenibacillus profundus TaxID=1173085 RepID=A0ABS8YMG9_9BACL|nr:DUF4111 domain-containing protein [Paenibacillus profundus]